MARSSNTSGKRGRPPKSSSSGRKKQNQKQPMDPAVKRVILGLCLIMVSIFALISLLTEMAGMLGHQLHDVLKGNLGLLGSLSLALCTGYLGVQHMRKEKRYPIGAYVLAAILFVLAMATLQNTVLDATVYTGDFVASFYVSGLDGSSGGIVGGFLSLGLIYLMGRLPATVILLILLLGCIIVLGDLTPYHLYSHVMESAHQAQDSLRRRQEEAAQKREEQALLQSPEEDAEAQKRIQNNRKKAKVDITLTDTPSSQLPLPEEEELPQEPVDVSFAEGLGVEPLPEEPPAAEDDIPNPVLYNADDMIPEEEFPAEEEQLSEAEALSSPPEDSYCYPPITLLKKDTNEQSTDVSGELKHNAQKLVDTLRSFGVETTILNIARGPAVTRYEIAPKAGVKVSRIVGLADDIALNLAASGVRIEAPIPGKAAVGIEVPNQNVDSILIRTMLETKEFKNAKSKVSAALGKDISGNPIVADLAKMPHVLIAGATGSGKSVCINTIITSILYKAAPNEVKLLMVDPKVVELGVYNGIPHLLIPVVTDPKKAAGALNWAVTEMLNRYKLFAETGVRDMKGYNEHVREVGEGEPLPQIVIIIDELADLMMAAPGDVEDAICRLAQMARAAGMHLVIATQRPSVDVITGVIKANIPSRISFAVSSAIDSRTILDGAGAEKLLGRGDMLYYPTGMAKPLRVQGCFVSDKEVESVVNFIKKSQTALYNEKIMEEIERNAAQTKTKGEDGGSEEEEDEMLLPAIEIAVEAGQASVSLMQRRLKLGYTRAARLMDEMEARGIVGPYEGSKPRQVLISKQEYQEMKLRRNDEQA